MTYSEFIEQLNKGTLSGVYMFEGPEQYLKEKTLADVREKLLVPGFEVMNENVFDGCTVQEIADAAETLPFMCDKRLVIAKDIQLSNSSEADPKLTSLLSMPPETCVIILYMRNEVSSKSATVKAIQTAGRDVAFELLSEADLSAWALDKLKSMKHTAKAAALNELIYLTGRQMGRLETELSKLSGFVGERREITLEDVKTLVIPDTDVSVFALVDNLAARKMAEAYKTLNSLLDNGEKTSPLLALIIRRVRLYAHISVLSDAGMVTEKQIAEKLGEKPYTITVARRGCNGISSGKLINAYKKCVAADYRVKSGQAEALPVLEEMMYLLYSLRG